MNIWRTPKTVAAFAYADVVPEVDWTKSQKTLDFLDLADHNRSIYRRYKELYDEEDGNFQSFWIKVVGKCAMDDCLVLFKKFTGEKKSIFFHESLKERKLDWIGRNVFLHFVSSLTKVSLDEMYKYLESGESAVHFLNLASLCGFKQWRNTSSIGLMTFQCIYPSILKGLYQNRIKHPLLVREFLDLFCIKGVSPSLFTDVPDAEHLDFMLDVANQTCFDFRDYPFDDLITKYVCQRRCHLVIKLLSYGFTLEDNSCSEELLFDLHYNLLKECNSISKLEMLKDEEDFREMFRMLFLSLSFPFVSHATVKEIINVDIDKFKGNSSGFCYYPTVIRHNTIERKESLWSTLLDLYKTLDKCGGLPPPNHLEPRRLSHLCRCFVRKSLRKNFRLPNAIDAMNIPTYIKGFLKLLY